jgi:hypothetical protein
MSTRSFGSLFMVASCAGAALGCYLVSLRVASERAALENVETRIVLADRDLRMLQTEIGTRGRLSQLERWNAGAFELSAPAASQFVEGGFELAKLVRPQQQVDFQAPVVLASAPAIPSRNPSLGQPVIEVSGSPAVSPSALLHEASLKTETREVPARTVVALAELTAPKSTNRLVTAARPAQRGFADTSGLAAAKSRRTPLMPAKPAPAASAVSHVSVIASDPQKKSVDKPALAAGRPVTKRIALAKTDPLAPLPDRHPGKTKDSPTGR